MSTEKKKTEAEMHEDLDKELEAAADEVFGSETAEGKSPESEAAAAEEAAGGTGEVATDGTPGDEKDDTAADEDDTAAAAKEGADAEGEGDGTDRDKPADNQEEDPYHIPDDVKGRTRARMEKFITDLKTANGELEEKTQLLQNVGQKFAESGLNAQEVESTLRLGSMLKSDPRKAHAALTHLLAKVSEQIGETPPGADPLVGYDDLQQRVENMELKAEDAVELAKARRRRDAEDRRAQQQQQQQAVQQQQQQQSAQQATAYQTSVAAAEVEVSQLIATAEKDPDFPKIQPILLEAATFAGENLAPDKWMSYLKGEIDKAKRLAKELGGSSSVSPLTDSSSSRHGNAAPKTLEDLADQML